MAYKSDGQKEQETNKIQKLPNVPWLSDRLFYGWIIVIVGFVTQFFQGLANQGFGTYLPYLEKEFGWSKAMMSAPRSVTQVNNAIFGPVEGWLVDRFGPRRVVTVGVFIMGGGLILFGMVDSLWLYFTSNIIIALGTGLQGLLVLSVSVNNWFRYKRSIAQSIMLLGFATAGAIGVTAIVFIQESINWQISAIGSGVLILILGFPLAQLLRTKPEQYGLMPDGDKPGVTSKSNAAGADGNVEYDFTLRQAIRTTAFWFLAISWAVGNLGLGAAQAHLFLHLEMVGLTKMSAALIWTVASLSNIPARLAGGFLGDKLPKNFVIAVSMVFVAVSIFILAMVESMQMALAYAILYGIGWGIRTPVFNAIGAEYFGRRSQGLIRGWLQSISIPFTIAAPILAGYAADVQGTYRYAFIIMALVMLGGSVMMFFTRAPKIPDNNE